MIDKASNAELNKTLAMIYALIGLRPQFLPTAQDDVLLFRFIREEYGRKTLDELYLAFKLAIKGELDIEDAKVYDQFTCEYIARIMTAYRKWLKAISSHITPEPVKKITMNNETTPEDMWIEIQEWEAKPKSEIRLQFIPPYLCDYFRAFGKIIVTDAMKNEYMTRAKEVIKSEMYAESERGKMTNNRNLQMQYKDFLIMYSERKWSAEYVYKFRMLAYKMLVYDYLSNKK